jgi:hypothetical protein
MGRPRKVFAGQKFGMLTALEPVDSKEWLCSCDCGIIRIVWTSTLTECQKPNCGCLRHYMHRRPTYRSWESAKARCRNPRHHKWALYGGRGILFSPEWDDFRNFIRDMGMRPAGTTLDRIRPDGNYEPGNCRWATPKEQRSNRRAQFSQ